MRGVRFLQQKIKNHAKKFGVASALLLSLGLGLLSVKPVSATTYVLSGSVKDSLGNAIVNATVSVDGAGIGNVSTDGSGNYTLYVPQGTYNVQATPAAGSNFSSAIAYGQDISGDKTLNFVLSPAGTVTFSGHLYNSEGTPLVNQTLILFVPGSSPVSRVTTDATGYFQLKGAPGVYAITISTSGPNNNNDFSQPIPQIYYVNISNYSLTQDTIRDITLPTKKVTVHVQDSSNNPVAGARVATGNTGVGSLSLGNGLKSGDGGNQYVSGQGPATDVSGNATLWLLPTKYNLTTTPPSGSPYLTKTLRDVSITDNTTLVVTLEQPVTLSGRILDAQGNGLGGQTISAIVPGNPASASSTTDSLGNYSLKVTPGTYNLSIFVRDDTFTKNIPQLYNLSVSNYTISQNEQRDITIPAKKVEVHVQDVANNPIAGTMLTTGTTGFSSISLGGGLTASGDTQYIPGQGPKTNANGDVTLWMLPTKYNLTATPPSGSSYSQVILRDMSVTADTQKTITMTRPITFSGHLYDGQGQPLASQQIFALVPGNSPIASATTTPDGSFSMQFTSGIYDLTVGVRDDSFTQHVPQVYHLNIGSIAFTQSTQKDITLPIKQVNIHVQDAFHNPVPGVMLSTGTTGFGLVSVGSDLPSASGDNQYIHGQGPTTDIAGNVTLWLFPTTYNLTATPPSGSIYSTFALTDLPITADQTEIISLQYTHNPPTTTASLSPDPYEDGAYANPVTVALDASATSGYTIANTYYTVDGGEQQTYATPFSVTGDGDHTITYWSVDNTGVREASKTKTFTIRANVAPTVNSLPTATISEGDTYTSSGMFADPDSTSWTATVDYGDGTGTQNLALSGNDFALNHAYVDEGTYTVTVSVADNFGATNSVTTSVTVNNVAPIIGVITASFNPIQVNTSTTASATFTDPGARDTHTATWDWGDGSTSSGTVTESNGSGSVSNSHTYTAVGVYVITLTLADNDGATSTQTFKYLSVYNPTANALFSGANHFNSPAGAYAANPSLAGKAQFGITAKYNQNNQPTGKASLTFGAANFSFDSTNLTLLVIANGTATLRGTGTVNGSGNYTFLATGIEGSTQNDGGYIRFQIKDEAGNIVYDTQVGDADTATPTASVTGRVVIH